MEIEDIMQPLEIDKSIHYVDDVMSSQWLEQVTNNLLSADFPWFYADKTSKIIEKHIESGGVKITGKCVDQGQFIHTMFWDGDGITSSNWHMVSPLTSAIEKLHEDKLGKLIRCKLNLITPVEGYPSDAHHVPHVDWNPTNRSEKYWSCVFYLTPADGDTFIFNESIQESPNELTLRLRNTPKPNSGIMFNSDLYHASSQCTTPATPRVICNMVWEAKK
jgi:hypothetical protein